jgi:hypothetical protein
MLLASLRQHNCTDLKNWQIGVLAKNKSVNKFVAENQPSIFFNHKFNQASQFFRRGSCSIAAHHLMLIKSRRNFPCACQDLMFQTKSS